MLEHLRIARETLMIASETLKEKEHQQTLAMEGRQQGDPKQV